LNIAARALYFENPEGFAHFFRKAAEISRIKVDQVSRGAGDTVNISLWIEFKNGKKVSKMAKNVSTVFRRDLGWRLNYRSVRSLLEAEGEIIQHLPGFAGEDLEDEGVKTIR